MTVYEELLAAANTVGEFAPQGDHESDAAYLTLFALHLNNVPDSVWSRLSPTAARWCNAAGERINAGGLQAEDCPGFAEAKLIDAAKYDAEQVELRPRGWIALVDHAVDPNCRISEPPLKGTDAIRAMVIEHPDWTQAQIAKALGDKVSASTIATVRSVTLTTIAIAKKLGKWKEAA